MLVKRVTVRLFMDLIQRDGCLHVSCYVLYFTTKCIRRLLIPNHNLSSRDSDSGIPHYVTRTIELHINIVIVTRGFHIMLHVLLSCTSICDSDSGIPYYVTRTIELYIYMWWWLGDSYYWAVRLYREIMRRPFWELSQTGSLKRWTTSWKYI